MYACVADLADAGAWRFVALFAVAHNAMFADTGARWMARLCHSSGFPVRCGLEPAPPRARLRRCARTAGGRLAHHFMAHRAAQPSRGRRRASAPRSPRV